MNFIFFGSSQMLGRRAALAAVFCFAMFAAGSALATPVNLVTNGNFSSGNTDFTSDYSYAPVPCSVHPDCSGEYTVGPTGFSWFNSFVTAGDHTTGNGSMFLGNGSDAVATVWETTVSGLDLNTDYFFEAFLMNICCTNQSQPGPQLQFFANNVLLGLGTTEIPGVWTGVSQLWNSGASSSVTLELRNASKVFNGNDFALDDVYLGRESEVSGAGVTPDPVPEPASIFLLGTGFLGLARGARRRLKAC